MHLMSLELDDLEQAVLRCLEDKPDLGFNDLLRQLQSKGRRTSRSGLSRRLKRLVHFGVVSKKTHPGWPPTTKYQICRPGRSRLVGRLPRWDRSLAVIGLVFAAVMTIAGLGLLAQHGKIVDLRSRLAAEQSLLAEQSRDLESKIQDLEASVGRYQETISSFMQEFASNGTVDLKKMIEARAEFFGVSELKMHAAAQYIIVHCPEKSLSDP